MDVNTYTFQKLAEYKIDISRPIAENGMTVAERVKYEANGQNLKFSLRDIELAIKEARNQFIANWQVEFIKSSNKKTSSIAEIIVPHADKAYKAYCDAVMIHWARNIKLKMAGKKATDHIMPILYGNIQGAGKTTLVEKILSYFPGAFVSAGEMQLITDDRSRARMLSKAVVFIDELAGAQKADIDTLKRVITSECEDIRTLGSNEVVEYRNNMSIISASNTSVYDVIQDTTGMRRYAQIDVTTFNWDDVNDFDYSAWWKSIDISKASPISHYSTYIANAGKVSVANPLHQFLDTLNDTVFFKSSELYLQYIAYCDLYSVPKNKRITTINKFGRDLKDICEKKVSKEFSSYRVLRDKLSCLIDVVLPEPLVEAEEASAVSVAPVAVKAATAAIKTTGLARFSMHNPIDEMEPDDVTCALNDDTMCSNDDACDMW